MRKMQTDESRHSNYSNVKNRQTQKLPRFVHCEEEMQSTIRTIRNCQRSLEMFEKLKAKEKFFFF